ncbi:MAG: PIN domain-containing protein [Nitriliruptorales bacterium]|nr:PIN domain-containing protein [Nitriliruptorales bacterium]
MSLPSPIALDTNCFIYAFEGGDTDRGAWLAERVFRSLAAGHLRAMTATLTIAELLTLAYRRGERSQAALLRSAVEGLPNLALRGLDVNIADRAAALRGASRLSLGDAVHLATAECAGAAGFLTNDRQLASQPADLAVLVLDDLVAQDSRRAR